MKRQAIITVEYDAEDYLGVKAQEGVIRRVLAGLKPDFEHVDVRFADRRPRFTPRAAAPEKVWPRS